jgi:hypothetical protein
VTNAVGDQHATDWEADLATAIDKARRDAPAIAVCEV